MRVIVIAADGLPAWALGAYGNDWLPTPNFDELAGQAVVFDQHFADAPRRLTRDSLGMTNDVLWIDAPSLLPPWNVEVDEELDFEPLLDPKPGLLAPDDDETGGRLHNTFALVVRDFDQWLGQRLSEEDINDEDLVIVTSGRGQNLGEHGLVGEARPWLHEELVHLPLIVRLPGGAEGGRRVPHVTQTSDLRGDALLPLCRGGGPIREYVVTMSEAGEEMALQTPHERIIVGEGRQLYFVKPDDRWEVNDLWQPNIDHAEALARMLTAYVAAARRPGPFTPPPLLQPEIQHGDGEASGREHDRPAGAGGLRGHQGDAKGGADQ
jgi:hypothetical protein